MEGRRGNQPVPIPADRGGGDDRRHRGAAKRGGAAAATLSAFALAGVGLSLASSGHAATASPQWLTATGRVPARRGVAFWVGALAPLAAMAWRPTQPLLPVLNRFSHAAIFVVAVLVLTGLALATVQLESFGALIDSQYGIILSIKLTLVAALLGLAALNRFRLTPALAADPRQHAAVGSLDPGRMRHGGWHFGRRRRLAFHAAAACAGAAAVRAAGNPYPHRECDVSGADFAGQGGRRQFRAAIDERRGRRAVGQGSDPDAEPAGARHRAVRA